MSHPDEMQPIRYLTCCVCGDGLRGRQWWNRDRGYGLCNGCADDKRTLAMNAAERERLYGVRGVHYAIPMRPSPDAPDVRVPVQGNVTFPRRDGEPT